MKCYVSVGPLLQEAADREIYLPLPIGPGSGHLPLLGQCLLEFFASDRKRSTLTLPLKVRPSIVHPNTISGRA